MNQKPSQLRLVLIWSHVVASRICALAIRGWSAMSAIGDVPTKELMARAAVACRPRPSRSAINSLQLTFGFGHGGFAVLGAGAVVGEHIDHDEVGNRGRCLLAGRSDAGSRQSALAGVAEHFVLRI